MTTTDDHDRLREDLAGYVLGGLTPAEQQAVEAHLVGCAGCRAELAELDPVPVLLDLAASASAPDAPWAEPIAPGVTVPSAAPGSPTPHPIEPGAPVAPVEPIGHRPRRRRGRALVASTAVALAMVAAFAVGLVVAAPGEPGYGAPVALHTVGGSPAAGSAAVRASDHGTEVRLVLEHLPSATGTWYECIWWSTSGRRWSAGTFRPGSAADTKVELLAAAALHPGWRLAILEHVSGRTAPTTVLQTSA